MDVESERVWGKEIRIKREGVRIDGLKTEKSSMCSTIHNITMQRE